MAQKLTRRSHDSNVQNLVVVEDDKSSKKLWSNVKSQRKEQKEIADLTFSMLKIKLIFLILNFQRSSQPLVILSIQPQTLIVTKIL